MHLQELNHRSPLRVFERSVHGGLGIGNLGVVVARAGVGKSAFLTGLAVDGLLRGRRVLHVTANQSVDHAREFYDEIFADLARSSNLEERAVAHEAMERNRIIRSLPGHPIEVARLEEDLATLREDAGFSPDVLIVEGCDLEAATARDELGRLRDLAGSTESEAWMSARIPRPVNGDDWHDMPEIIARHEDLFSVVVRLQPVGDSIRVRLLKDHDNQDIADLSLDLDPTTLLLKQGPV